MTDRVQNEFSVLRPIQGPFAPVRPHLAVGPLSETVENPATAVAPTGASHKTSVDEFLNSEKALLDVMGNIHKEGDVLIRNAERRKALDAIVARLFNAKHVANGTSSPAKDDEPVVRIEGDLHTLGEEFPGIAIAGRIDGQPERPQNAAERVAAEDRSRVIAKIEAALKRVEKLRAEITESDGQAYSRLLNVGSAVSGLTVARSRVSENIGSLSSATNTAENVMVNLRAVVLATHGKVSPEIVRLVLP